MTPSASSRRPRACPSSMRCDCSPTVRGSPCTRIRGPAPTARTGRRTSRPWTRQWRSSTIGCSPRLTLDRLAATCGAEDTTVRLSSSSGSGGLQTTGTSSAVTSGPPRRSSRARASASSTSGVERRTSCEAVSSSPSSMPVVGRSRSVAGSSRRPLGRRHRSATSRSTRTHPRRPSTRSAARSTA